MGTHAVLFYCAPESKYEVLFSHLKYGAGRQGLAYVCSEETPQHVQDEMKKFGLDTDELRAKDMLAIDRCNELYIVNGEVNIPKIMNSFSELSKKYKRMGLEGLRAAAEMSCFFRENKMKELMKYEYTLHRKFGFPAEGICAYNVFDMTRSGHLEMLMPMLRAHSTAILAGPKESVIVEPEKVEDKDVERTMHIEM